MKLSDRVRDERKKMGLSQAALAKRAGFGQTTIADIERDHIKSSRYVAKLAAIFGVRLEWLTTGEGEKHSTDKLDLRQKALALNEISTALSRIPIDRLQLLLAEIESNNMDDPTDDAPNLNQNTQPVNPQHELAEALKNTQKSSPKKAKAEEKVSTARK